MITARHWRYNSHIQSAAKESPLFLVEVLQTGHNYQPSAQGSKTAAAFYQTVGVIKEGYEMSLRLSGVAVRF